MKVCTICKRSLEEINFAKDKTLKCGLTAQCKECRNAKKKEWEQNNKDKVQAYSKKYRKDNLDRISKDNIIRCKEYYTKNKEDLKYYQKSYKKANKGIVNAQNSKRRAQKILATPLWVLSNKEELNKIEKLYKEAIRLTETTGIEHHVDHIIPLLGKNVSGFHCYENLQILTAEENMKKGNRHISDNNI